jgi:hypothetical protein
MNGSVRCLHTTFSADGPATASDTRRRSVRYPLAGRPIPVGLNTTGRPQSGGTNQTPHASQPLQSYAVPRTTSHAHGQFSRLTLRRREAYAAIRTSSHLHPLTLPARTSMLAPLTQPIHTKLSQAVVPSGRRRPLSRKTPASFCSAHTPQSCFMPNDSFLSCNTP